MQLKIPEDMLISIILELRQNRWVPFNFIPSVYRNLANSLRFWTTCQHQFIIKICMCDLNQVQENPAPLPVTLKTKYT